MSSSPPWTVDKRNFPILVTDQNGMVVAEFHPDSDLDGIASIDNERQTLAEAVMTSAAPDMLEACQLFTRASADVVDALNRAGVACPSSIAMAAERARAAIAKATS